MSPLQSKLERAAALYCAAREERKRAAIALSNSQVAEEKASYELATALEQFKNSAVPVCVTEQLRDFNSRRDASTSSAPFAPDATLSWELFHGVRD